MFHPGSYPGTSPGEKAIETGDHRGRRCRGLFVKSPLHFFLPFLFSSPGTEGAGFFVSPLAGGTMPHAVPHCHFLLVPEPSSLPSSPSSSLHSPIILSNPLLSLECLKSLLVNQALDQPFWKTKMSGIQTSEIYP